MFPLDVMCVCFLFVFDQQKAPNTHVWFQGFVLCHDRIIRNITTEDVILKKSVG